MCRIFLQTSFFTITWYGVMAAIGALSGFYCLKKFRNIAGLSEDQTYDLLLYTMIAGIIGARLLYVIQFWDNFKNNLIEIIKIHHGGLVFYGGFFFSIAAIYIFCRRNKLDFIKVIDICAPSVALTHFFGRIGCFLNGCCFGRPTEMPWGVVFPKNSDPYLFYGEQIKIHPTQLYEAAGNLVVFFILSTLIRKLKRGQTAALYLAIYGTMRFIIEMFRGDHSKLFLSAFTTAQIIGIIIIPLGIMSFVYFGQRSAK